MSHSTPALFVNGTEVINKLKGLRQLFLTPAKKTVKVKKAIERYEQGVNACCCGPHD
jgi:hypothetical protein